MGRAPKTNLPYDLALLLKRVGGNIRDRREKIDMTQAELASKSKVSVTTLNEIESRRFRDIRLSTLVAIAKILEVSVPSLLQGSDVKLSSGDRARFLKASEELVRLGLKLRHEDS